MSWYSWLSPSRSFARSVRLSAVLAGAVLLTVAATLTTFPGAQAHSATATRALNCPTCHQYQDGELPGIFHKATAGNSDSDYTILDNPYTNAQPNEILMATQFWNYPQGSAGVFNDHNIGVWYDGTQWTVFNEDGSKIPVGATFSVAALSPSSTAFTITATASTIVGDYVLLNSPLLNGNSSAQVFVTPVFGSTDQYNNHPVGVWYTGSQWAIFNEDQAPMQAGEMFNVILALLPGSECFHTVANSSNMVGDTILLFDMWTRDGGVEWETPDWGTSGPFLNHPTGMFIYGTPWDTSSAYGAIFDEDQGAMVSGAMFNYCELNQ